MPATKTLQHTDQISWDHEHLILLLENKEKVNLHAYIFHRLYENIKECKKHKKKNIPYGRLLFELFYQSRLIQNLRDFGASLELDIEYEKTVSSNSGTYESPEAK